MDIKVLTCRMDQGHPGDGFVASHAGGMILNKDSAFFLNNYGYFYGSIHLKQHGL